MDFCRNCEGTEQLIIMAKLDLYGGLLGNGKTTLIKRMLKTAYAGRRVAVIENEIGEINLDSEEFTENSVSVREVTAGCLCCTVKGSFQEAVRTLVQTENPDYIIVEPTGAADLWGIIEACVQVEEAEPNRCILAVNARKIQVFLKVVGEFFYDQIRTARTVYLNFAEKLDARQIRDIKKELKTINPNLEIVDTPMKEIDEDTFRESQFSGGEWKAAKKNNPIQIVSAKEPVKMLPAKRNVKQLLTWTVRFQETFSTEKIKRLLALLEDAEHCRLWRVKGYLPMEGGAVQKVDVAYGEVFQEPRESVSPEKIGVLILIGEKLDIQWLQRKIINCDIRLT